jgi:hypothetical protein
MTTTDLIIVLAPLSVIWATMMVGYIIYHFLAQRP